MRTLIVGCGYLGLRVGRLLRARGCRVFGTTRSPARAGVLRESGIEPVVLDVLRTDSLNVLPLADRVLYCVGYDRTAGVPMRTVYVDGLRHALGRLSDRVGGLVYASSTGVYSGDDGGWVDEDSPAEPRHEAGRVCLEGEQVARQVAEARRLPAAILRFSGLYGPGRLMRRATIEAGQVIAGDPNKFLNLIHIDDAAAATVAAIERAGPGRLYHVTDDRPVERQEFYGRLAELLQAPPPRFRPPEPGSPEAARDESNKRVSNRRMHDELGVTLCWPDIAAGLPEAVAADAAAGSVALV